MVIPPNTVMIGFDPSDPSPFFVHPSGDQWVGLRTMFVANDITPIAWEPPN